MEFLGEELFWDYYLFDILFSPWVRFSKIIGSIKTKRFLVGKPINVIQINNPTSNDIDQLHQRYLQALEQLFEDNKEKYGLKHVNLKII